VVTRDPAACQLLQELAASGVRAPFIDESCRATIGAFSSIKHKWQVLKDSTPAIWLSQVAILTGELMPCLSADKDRDRDCRSVGSLHPDRESRVRFADYGLLLWRNQSLLV